MTDIVYRKRFIADMDNLLMRIPCIVAFEKYLLTLPQVAIDTHHTFAGGVYIRQVTIPAGAMCTGKRHRYPTCDIMLTGVMSLYNGYGKKPVKVAAPMINESPAFAKKFGYAIEDTVWLNAFPTSETDVEKIESDIFVSEKEYKEMREQPCQQ